jgi:hypothetical protein
MKFILFLTPLLFILYFSMNGCVSHNEEDLYGENCDTLNLTYSKVEYIFQNNCYTCHHEGFFSHDIKLDSYVNVKAAINTNKFWPAINQTGPYKMPKGQPLLDSCLLAKIGAWVNVGMPE